MPVALKMQTPSKHTERAQTQAVPTAGIPSPCTKLLRADGGCQGNKTQGSQLGCLQHPAASGAGCDTRVTKFNCSPVGSVDSRTRWTGPTAERGGTDTHGTQRPRTTSEAHHGSLPHTPGLRHTPRGVLWPQQLSWPAPKATGCRIKDGDSTVRATTV